MAPRLRSMKAASLRTGMINVTLGRRAMNIFSVRRADASQAKNHGGSDAAIRSVDARAGFPALISWRDYRVMPGGVADGGRRRDEDSHEQKRSCGRDRGVGR